MLLAAGRARTSLSTRPDLTADPTERCRSGLPLAYIKCLVSEFGHFENFALETDEVRATPPTVTAPQEEFLQGQVVRGLLRSFMADINTDADGPGLVCLFWSWLQKHSLNAYTDDITMPEPLTASSTSHVHQAAGLADAFGSVPESLLGVYSPFVGTESIPWKQSHTLGNDAAGLPFMDSQSQNVTDDFYFSTHGKEDRYIHILQSPNSTKPPGE
eukprot:gene12196-335_t